MNKVAVVQMVSCGAIGPNLVTAKAFVEKATDAGAKMVVLPQYFAYMPDTIDNFQCVAERLKDGRIQKWASQLAADLGIWLVAGSIPIQAGYKIIDMSVVYDPKGNLVAHYARRHFINTPQLNNELEKETDVFEPGKEVVIFETPFGKCGLALGYDLYFPEHFARLREAGAELICLPASFHRAVADVHFKSLVRARAIENQCYILAAAQGGLHDNDYETLGSSRILGPWGLVLEKLEVGPSFAAAPLDMIRLAVLREDFVLR